MTTLPHYTQRVLSSGATYRLGNLMIDAERYLVTINGRRCSLSRLTFALLYHMVQQPDVPLSYETLYRALWPEAKCANERNAVKCVARRLRAKLAQEGSAYNLITVWGQGYRLAADKTGVDLPETAG